MPNPFLYKYSLLFQTIQFVMNTQFTYQKHFFFKTIVCLQKRKTSWTSVLRMTEKSDVEAAILEIFLLLQL